MINHNNDCLSSSHSINYPDFEMSSSKLVNKTVTITGSVIGTILGAIVGAILLYGIGATTDNFIKTTSKRLEKQKKY